MQPVRELDHQHPDVLGHGHNHLADSLGLCGLTELDLVQLGDAVHEHRDLRAEIARQVSERVGSVLHGVVQERSGQGCAGETQFSQDRGHCHGVGDVRIAALPLLPLMASLGYA